MMFDADKYWRSKEKPCPYAEGNRCFLVAEPRDESCKGCRWYEYKDLVKEKNMLVIENCNSLSDLRQKLIDGEEVRTARHLELEPLTDKEQRIFLAAMGREEKICREVDDKYSAREAYEDSLVSVCRSIERKVKKALWR